MFCIELQKSSLLEIANSLSWQIRKGHFHLIHHLIKICNTALINEEVKIGIKKLKAEKDDSELGCCYQISN